MKAFALVDFDSGPALRDLPIPEPGSGEIRVRPAGEEHWHGATVDTVLWHLAVSVGETRWLDVVSDEDYEAALGRE